MFRLLHNSDGGAMGGKGARHRIFKFAKEVSMKIKFNFLAWGVATLTASGVPNSIDFTVQ
jgi:hypothetical protein